LKKTISITSGKPQALPLERKGCLYERREEGFKGRETCDKNNIRSAARLAWSKDQAPKQTRRRPQPYHYCS
jgi:hypothetical protein